METMKLMFVLLFLSTGTAMAQEARVTPLLSKDLKESPGREVVMITVEYAPGGGWTPFTDTMRRHSFTCLRAQS